MGRRYRAHLYRENKRREKKEEKKREKEKKKSAVDEFPNGGNESWEKSERNIFFHSRSRKDL